MSDKHSSITSFFERMFDNPIEDRAVEYIVRELESGRALFEILNDPYVRNRIPEDRRVELLESPEVLAAFEAEIKAIPSADSL